MVITVGKSATPMASKVLKIVLAYYAVTMLTGLGFAAICNPADFTYDFSMLRAVVGMMLSGQALWLLWRRAKGARTFCIVATAVNMLMSVVDLAFFGAFADLASRVGMILAVLLVLVEFSVGGTMIAYLLRSPSLDRILTARLDRSSEGSGNSWDTPWRERIRTWPFWRDLSIYFIVFSFLGHWAEMLFCRMIVAGVFMGDYDPTNAMLWDQWLFPFSAEGTALAMVVLVLHPVKEWLLKRFDGKVLPALALSFLINQIVCTSIDFGTGMVANQHFELWDYRNMPFNFMGQVCLQNSLVYTIAATLIVWLVYPLMDRALRKMPRWVVNATFVALAGIYAFEALLHFVYVGM